MTDLKKLTRRECAELLGVHYRSTSNFLNEDDPLPANRDGRTFNANTVLKWYVNRCIQRSGKPGIESQEAIAWLEKFRRERYRLSKLERKERTGQLLPVKEIHEQWAARVRAVAAGLEAFADRLPPLIVGKDRGAVAAVLREEVKMLRSAYERSGRYSPVETEVEGDADGPEKA